MPLPMNAFLRSLNERANPNVVDVVEMAAPDVGQVLRRWSDQFSATPPKVSESPASSTDATAAGALTLASATTLLAQRWNNNLAYPLNKPDPSKRIFGVGWQLDAGFTGALLERFTARVRRIGVHGKMPTDFALQIYQWRGQYGVLQQQQGSSYIETPFLEWTPQPLLKSPALVPFKSIVWTGDDGELQFDLVPFALEVYHRNIPPPAPNRVGEAPYYMFVVEATRRHPDGAFEWRGDNTSPGVVAGIGTFGAADWQRSNPSNPASQWGSVFNASNAPNFKLDVRGYSPTSTVIYAVTLPAVPSAESTGRVVFERSTPPGTSATLEISTAGAAGPWTAVSHGDPVTIKQATYHFRVVLTPGPGNRRAPWVGAIGVEFRTVTDLTAEAIVQHLSHDVDVPFLQGAIGEGRVSVVRTGRRDYRDPAADIVTSKPDTRLELDVFFGSTHQQAPRSTWLRTARATVSTRTPTPTAESFALLSFAKTLKRAIPQKIEAINRVHVVTGTPSVTQVQVTPALQGTTAPGNEYDGQGYYIRVRKSSQAGVESGYLHPIFGNTGIDRLDFDPASPLPGVLAVGDEIEVHSGTYAQPALTWQDADPADVWEEILTAHLAVPRERLGYAGLGADAKRAGLPPRVTDRAPGDASLQARLRVSRRIDEATPADELLDQLSFLMGGVTTEIGGQIVYRQIYPIRDANGAVVVAGESAAATFGPGEYGDLDAPTGREERVTILACAYGIDTTVAGEARSARTAVYIDDDARAWFTDQDLEDLGAAVVPDDIAKWCYNTADEGLTLATLVCQQVVRALSTGKRVWAWRTVDRYPELIVGDTVVIITDQYTDYDPSTQRAFRGWWAYPLVLVGVDEGGRRFRGFMLGLSAAAPVLGGIGTLAPGVTDPAATGLKDFRYVESSDGTRRTYRWDRGDGVDAVWVYDRITTLPVVADLSPLATDTPTAILPRSVNEYTADKPPAGYARFLWFVPVLSALPGGVAATGPVKRGSMFGPGAYDVTIEPSETAGQWQLTVTISDPGGLLHASTPVRFYVTQLGVETLEAPTTAPTGTTSGVYTKTGALDSKHPIVVEVLLTHIDDSEALYPSHTFDFDKRANVQNLSAAYGDFVATITAKFDTDTGIGANQAEYQVDGGAWTPLTVDADRVAQFNVAQSPSGKKSVKVRGKTTAGVAGPEMPIEVDQVYQTSGGADNRFSALTNVLFSYATDQVDFGWTWHGGGAPNFKVYVRDGAGSYNLVATVTASTYRYTSGWNLDAGGAGGTVDIGFYVQAESGGVVLATSAIKTSTYPRGAA